MKLEAHAGEHIEAYAKRMQDAYARQLHPATPVEGEFNGIDLTHGPGSTWEGTVDFFHKEQRRRAEEYRNSDEYKERQRRAEERESERKNALAEALRGAPEEPTWSSQESWDKWRESNQDGYGGACISYARRWARAMEGAISKGKKLEDVADELSHLADSEGITGFMYGCAVQMLSQCWLHGEELRKWHNLKTQTGTEGESANESGAVLNPAVLSIGSC